MKKRMVALLLVAVCALMMTACGGKDVPTDGSAMQESSAQGEAPGDVDLPPQDQGDDQEQTGESDGDAYYDVLYRQTVPYDQEFFEDLDGDGTKDTIMIASGWDEYGMRKLTVTVNGKNMDEYTTDMYNETPGEEFYIVDLDNRDNYKEIVVSDNGMSDDPVSFFYRYADGKMMYMGCIYDLFENEHVSFDGLGKIQALMPLYMIETVDAEVTYEVKDGSIQLVEQEWYDQVYPGYMESPMTYTVLQDLMVYTKADTASEKATFAAGTTDFKILATDNEEWVKISDKDGKIFYLHMTEENVIDSDGTEIYTWDAIEGLFQVG